MERLEDRRLLATLVVNTTADNETSDANLTLREAIEIVSQGGLETDTFFFQSVSRTLTQGEKDRISGTLGDNDVISLQTISGTITLSPALGRLELGRGAAILGSGAGVLTIDANLQSQILWIGVAGDDNVQISGLKFREGSGSAGGAIEIVFGNDALIQNCIFEANEAGSGGAIYVHGGAGEVTVETCQFYANVADGNGGAIYIELALVDFTLRDSVVSGNTALTPGGGLGSGGGGLAAWFNDYATTASLLIERTAFKNNTTNGEGGGIFIGVQASGESNFDVMIKDTTISGNSASAESNSGFGSEGGGGIWMRRLILDEDSDANFDIVNSTISGNQAPSGGGCKLEGKINVRYSTIVENLAGYDNDFLTFPIETGGGGVLIANARKWNGYTGDYYPDNLPRFRNCIIAGNRHEPEFVEESQWQFSPNIDVSLDEVSGHHGAISNGQPYYSYWFNDLLPLSDDPINYPDEWYWRIEGLLLDHVLIDDLSGPLDPSQQILNYVGTVIVADPNIGPLADNKGFDLPDGNTIQTRALLEGSPAIDAGSPGLVAGVGPVPTLDERGTEDGYVFRRIYDWPGNGRGLLIDLGAYEKQHEIPIDGDADFDQDSDVDGADFLIWQVGLGLTGLNLLTSNDRGDADEDGDVDGNDLAIWREQYGQNPGINADFNNDSTVDADDFLLWQENRGMASGANLADGDADNDDDVDEEDFLAWQIAYSLETGLNEWMVHTLDYAQLTALGADQILVSTLADENDGDFSLGDLSLREALAIAADIGGGHEIFFANHLAGTMELNGSTLGNLVIASEVTINGPGVDRLTIDAQDDSGIFLVNAGVTATIRGLTMTGGDAYDGGAIFNWGNLTLDHVAVVGNVADHIGGGIASRSQTGSLASLTIVDSTIDDNTAKFGSGINVDGPTHSLVIDRSTISNNRWESTVYAEAGGLRFDSSGGTATIKNSTFSGNRASYVGAIRVSDVSATVSIINSTIAHNDADFGGGGIQRIGTSATITVHNSIVAKNLSGTTNNDVIGAIATASSHNIFGAGAGSVTPTGANNQIGNPTTPVDPKLETLADNCGPTKTHKLKVDSPAIDAASTTIAFGNSLGSDQRGYCRYVYIPNTSVVVDMGAYEYGLIVTVPNDPTTNGYARNDLSLREALAQAALIDPTGTLGRTVIEFAPEVYNGTLGSGVFTLSGTHLLVSSPIDIVGPGADLLTINAASGKTVFAVSNGSSGTFIDVLISGLTIDGDNVGNGADGGAIYSEENLTLDSVVVTRGRARSGGGLYQKGSASLTVVDSAFTGNTAYYGGGAVVDDVDNVLIASSTFHGNDAIKWMNPGWVAGSGSAAGLHLLNIASSNPADIVNSTFSGNDAEHDGGAMVLSAAYAVLLNDTIAFNTAAGTSGAIGGIHMLGSNLTLHNTILAKNTLSGGASDIGLLSSTVNADSSYNILGLAGGSGLTNGVKGNQVGTSTPLDPLLEALADNGGPTWTHKLEIDSPAIDVGGYEQALTFLYDQRRSLRFDDGDGDNYVGLDIGAFELSAEEYFEELGA